MSMLKVVLSCENVMTLRDVIEDALREDIEELRKTELERHKGVSVVMGEERVEAFYQDVVQLLKSDLVSLYVLFVGEEAEIEPGEAEQPTEDVLEAAA